MSSPSLPSLLDSLLLDSSCLLPLPPSLPLFSSPHTKEVITSLLQTLPLLYTSTPGMQIKKLKFKNFPTHKRILLVLLWILGPYIISKTKQILQDTNEEGEQRISLRSLRRRKFLKSLLTFEKLLTYLRGLNFLLFLSRVPQFTPHLSTTLLRIGYSQSPTSVNVDMSSFIYRRLIVDSIIRLMSCLSPVNDMYNVSSIFTKMKEKLLEVFKERRRTEGCVECGSGVCVNEYVGGCGCRCCYGCLRGGRCGGCGGQVEWSRKGQSEALT